jgi:hypothetical protein
MNLIKKLFGNRHLFDLYQALPLFAIAGLILVPDSGSMVVLYAIGISILVSSVSHIIRKVLFPYLDLELFAKKALESPVGAAVVFASIVLILAVIIISTCLLLH